MGPAHLRGYASDLDALAGALDAAVQVHGAAAGALVTGADALDGAWSSPLGAQVVTATRAGYLGLLAPPGALADAAAACRALADRARQTAAEVQQLEADLAAVQRALATVGPDPDPSELDRLRRERTRLRQQLDAALSGWSQACAATAPRLAAAADATRDGASRAASASASIPRVPLALAGDGAAMPTGDDRSPGDVLLSSLAWSQRLATLGTLHELVWIHPALARVPQSFRREVLALPEAARLAAFLRWQEEVGRRVPLPLALNRLATEGTLPPSYLAAAPRDVPTAPNLSAGARATSGLRIASRWLAPFGVYSSGQQLVSADSNADRVAAGAGLFSAGVGTASLVGMSVFPPVAIAAAVAGGTVLLYEGWKHREAIGEWISGAWSWTTDALSSAWEWTSGALTSAWDWAVSGLSSAWNWTTDAAGAAWDWGTSAVSSAWDWTTDTVSSAWNTTTDAASRAWDWGTDAASSAWDWGRDTASSAWDGVTGFASSLWSWGGDAIDWAKVKAADVWDWTTDAASAVAGWTADRIDDVRTWMSDTAGAVIDWSRDHLPTPVTGGRTLWWLQQASESVFGTATPPPTLFEQPELLAPIFDGTGAAPPADPAAVAAIFADLDPVAARDLVLSNPAVLGGLDGVPPGLRHEANLATLATERTRVDGRLAEIDARLGELGALAPGDHVGRSERSQLRSERIELLDTAGHLRALERRLAASPGGRDHQLLLFDPALGRVAVANRDLTAATNVTTLALGTGSDIGSVTDGLNDLAEWSRLAEQQAPGSRHAHVLWLGYDPPPNLLAATSAAPAQRGAPAFADFTAGVRAVNPDAHHLAGGHSYGSSLAGEAAATHGLDVDGLLLLASPGGRAGHVDDYRLPDHAVVSVATDVAFRSRGDHDLGGGDVIGVVSGGQLTQALGPDPTSSRFGADVLDVHDAGGHGRSEYLAAESRSLDALSRASNGQAPR